MKNIEKFFRLAAIISALPNTISNGQTADAVPLMADLNHIVNQVNANAADATLVPLLAAANSFTAVQSGLAATSAANFPIASQIQDSVFLTLTSTLGTNTITARCAAFTLGALANGQIFTFVPSQTNTGPATLNPDGVGAAAIFLGGTNVISGQIVKDVPLALRYESPRFHAIALPGGPFSTLDVINNATIGGTLGVTGKITPTGGIVGTTTNDSATALNVGEYVSSVVSTTNFPATGVWGDLTSISLTAGDWDVTAIVDFGGAGAVYPSTTLAQMGISATSGNSTAGLVSGSNLVYIGLPPSSASDGLGTIPSYRVSISGTTTYYLKYVATYTGATPVGFGRLSARRVR